jgi:malate dehydrogenase
MLAHSARFLTTKTLLSKTTAAAAMSTKVAVLGAGGGIGQPLSMLLKLSPHIDELACYDIVGTPGVAADLSHVRTII